MTTATPRRETPTPPAATATIVRPRGAELAMQLPKPLMATCPVCKGQTPVNLTGTTFCLNCDIKLD